jgi:hypothetical protein
MTSVSELITNILNGGIMKRVDDLEKRFLREASEITDLEMNIDILKSKNN